MGLQPKKPSRKAGLPNFTGEVWADDLARGEGSSRVRVTAVHFAPGARTAWHAHSVSQTLYVTEGEGRAQTRGSEVLTLRAGDAIFATADEWHWHGAAPDRVFTHLSIVEEDPTIAGPSTNWGPSVTEEEYGA
jgi:quercetin dioxygenase-like cupin family protein